MGQREPGQCARKKSGWIRMARRTRFAAWMMAALMVSSAASAQSDADCDEVPAEEVADDSGEAEADQAASAAPRVHAYTDAVAPDRPQHATSPQLAERRAPLAAGAC